MTVFHPFSFKIRRLLGAYVAPSPTGFWLGRPRVYPAITSYPTTLPWILHLSLSIVCAQCRGGTALSYHPHSFVKCCHMFCNVYFMFEGANSIFLSARLMFLVVVFMCYWGCFMLHTWILMISFKIWSEWYFIIHSNQSWISVQIALNLVCKPISYFICHFYNRLLIET